MAKFFKFCFYTTLGVFIGMLIRALFGMNINVEGAFAHLWYGLITAGTYHWFLCVTNDEKTSNQ